MSNLDSTFYISGGTLRHDAPSYVERKADWELLDGLLKGEFCYVLTSRQMGKSSLMVRTASKLREQGVAVVVLDLTAIGQNLTPEQWYHGLLVRAGRQLELEDQLDQFWDAHPKLSPVQRFCSGIRDIVLTQRKQPLIIFVDEIDTVRSLPFSTDEFFAAIRECYNRRTEDPEFNRLTFCLLGVATPSDLIRDTRITPFNIGRRIELHDFMPEEADPLATGLRVTGSRPSTLDPRRLLSRILHWTNGHPYLTQRLCQAVAQDGLDPDEACTELFFSARARERDDNLIFVRERLRTETDRAGLLQLYAQVLHGKKVPDDERDSLVGVLKLSGVARSCGGALSVRNRIYKRVFDREWIRANMPHGELRRQRAAFLKGVVRTAVLAAVAIAIVLALALSERRQAHRAERNLYAADMLLAMQALEGSNLGQAKQLLQKYLPKTPTYLQSFLSYDLRGWEWRYLWRLCRSDELVTLGKQQAMVEAVAFSPDGRTLFASGHEQGVRLWNTDFRGQFEVLPHVDAVETLTCSPDSRLLATGSYGGLVVLWDLATKRSLHIITNAAPVRSLRFSLDGKILAAGFQRTSVKLWDVATWTEITEFPTYSDHVLGVGLAFTSDSRTFAYGLGDGRIILWDVPTRSHVATLTGHSDAVMALEFSRDGRILISSADDGDRTVKAWDVATRSVITNVTTFGSWVGSLALSPDEKFLAAASADQKIKFFDVATWTEIALLRGHLDEVWSIAFSPDGKILASGSKDKTVRLWSGIPKPADEQHLFVNPYRTELGSQRQFFVCLYTNGVLGFRDITTLREFGRYSGPLTRMSTLAISPQGTLLAAGDADGPLSLWDCSQDTERAPLHTNVGEIGRLEFSRDGAILAVAGIDGTIRLWDLATTNLFATFQTRQKKWNRMRFSHDGTLLAVASTQDFTPEIWDLSRKEKLAELAGHEAGVNEIVLTRDKKTAATASWDGTMKLWDMKTRKEVASFRGQLRGYRCVAISADDRRVAAGGSDSVIEVWDLNTHQAVARLKGHTGHVFQVSFSPDDSSLASLGEDGVRLWRAPALTEIVEYQKK